MEDSTPAEFCLRPDDERLQALAEFAAGAGHEINNPLATIVGRVQQLLRGESDPVRRQALLTIGAQAYRVRDMIGDVMLFARPPEPERRDCLLTTLVEQIRLQWIAGDEQSSVRLVPGEVPAVSLNLDPAQFAIVLHELLRNAREASVGIGTEICLRGEVSGQWVLVIVEDRGQGFSEEARRHAFDPFYSARQAGRGLGFGLCKVWRIVTGHGGRVEIDSMPAGPTRVTTWWPLV